MKGNYFKKLTDKFKNNIKFRWELPRGVSFVLEEKREVIVTEEQMLKFLKHNEDELTK